MYIALIVVTAIVAAILLVWAFAMLHSISSNVRYIAYLLTNTILDDNDDDDDEDSPFEQ